MGGLADGRIKAVYAAVLTYDVLSLYPCTILCTQAPQAQAKVRQALFTTEHDFQTSIHTYTHAILIDMITSLNIISLPLKPQLISDSDQNGKSGWKTRTVSLGY